MSLAVARSSRTQIADDVRMLARVNKVRYEPGALDAMAGKITELAGDAVELDEIELLIVALGRAGVLSGPQAAKLQARYLSAP